MVVVDFVVNCCEIRHVRCWEFAYAQINVVLIQKLRSLYMHVGIQFTMNMYGDIRESTIIKARKYMSLMKKYTKRTHSIAYPVAAKYSFIFKLHCKNHKNELLTITDIQSLQTICVLYFCYTRVLFVCRISIECRCFNVTFDHRFSIWLRLHFHIEAQLCWLSAIFRKFCMWKYWIYR